MMSSHWKLFLFPCHKVWAHFGMALWFISLTSSAGSAQTPREIQALPPLVPGKVDFRSPFLKKKQGEEEAGSLFSKTLGHTVGTMSWKILLHYWVAKPRWGTCQFSKQRGAVWIRRYCKSALLIAAWYEQERFPTFQAHYFTEQIFFPTHLKNILSRGQITAGRVLFFCLSPPSLFFFESKLLERNKSAERGVNLHLSKGLFDLKRATFRTRRPHACDGG